MHIMFLTHYFPPEVNAPASRTFEHAREWVKAGHRVTIVTCAPNHPKGEVYPGYRNRFFQRETRDGIEIVRIWTWLARNEGFLLRTTNFVSYLVMATLVAPFLPRPDIVVSTSPQFFCGLAGWTVSRIKRRPWVLEIRDLWPESITAVGAVKSRFLIRILEGLERFAYRSCDKIVSVTDGFVDHFVKCGVPRDKVLVVKNGADLTRYVPQPKDDALLAEFGLQGKFVAAYFGTLGMAHKLSTVLEAAELSKDDPSLVYVIMGDGAERQRLAEGIEERRLTNVLMLDQQPKDRMPAFWGSIDASLVLLRKDDLFKTVIPSKIFEAMAMEKPIVIGVEGESRAIVEAAGAGIPIEPENAAELVAALKNLAADPARARAMGQAGKSYVAGHFDRRILAARLLAMMQAPFAKSG